MTTTEKAISWMESIAADNEHGYSQSIRWGPSYDCSSLVISAWQQAGVPVKDRGATFTGNMYEVFRTCGFDDVTGSVILSTGANLKRGDVLLNKAEHTAMYCGGGNVVHARSSEGTNDTRDNSGNEIRVQKFWNYPWDSVLRYKESTTVDSKAEDEKTEEYEIPKPDIPYEEVVDVVSVKTETDIADHYVHICRPGEMSWFVGGVQYLLKAHCYNVQFDNKYQIETAKCVLDFQDKHGLDCDAEVGYFTWNELFKGKELRIGDMGFSVKAVQCLLRALGFYIGDGDPDGIYGSNVFVNIRALQGQRGIKQTGFVNNETWNELIKF